MLYFFSKVVFVKFIAEKHAGSPGTGPCGSGYQILATWCYGSSMPPEVCAATHVLKSFIQHFRYHCRSLTRIPEGILEFNGNPAASLLPWFGHIPALHDIFISMWQSRRRAVTWLARQRATCEQDFEVQQHIQPILPFSE